MKQTFYMLTCLTFLVAGPSVAPVPVQRHSVSADFVITRAGNKSVETSTTEVRDASNVVVWLTPLDRAAEPPAVPPAGRDQPPRLVQRNKTFEPHLLVVPVGTLVVFPNEDPFFHNIFSLYDGRRFDLGLYESGMSRSVRFDRSGVSFLFCNIHAEMSAVVIALDTNYFAVSNHSGHVVIPDVPEGSYRLNIWYELATPEELQALTRVVSILNANVALGAIRVSEASDLRPAHKNKYGLDYVPPPQSDYDR
jgi:plastocyanin